MKTFKDLKKGDEIYIVCDGTDEMEIRTYYFEELKKVSESYVLYCYETKEELEEQLSEAVLSFWVTPDRTRSGYLYAEYSEAQEGLTKQYELYIQEYDTAIKMYKKRKYRLTALYEKEKRKWSSVTS